MPPGFGVRQPCAALARVMVSDGGKSILGAALCTSVQQLCRDGRPILMGEGRRQPKQPRCPQPGFGTAWIDGRTYTLTADTLVENRTGRRLQVKDLRWENIQFRVEYWQDGSQISQIVIYFPE